MSFFFILTGAGISIRFWSSIFNNTPPPSAKKFFWERFVRLAPVYWIVLIVSFLLVSIYQGITGEWILRLVTWFFFLSWVHPITFFPVEMNGPLWYIPFDLAGSIIAFSMMSQLARIQKNLIPAGILGTVWLLVLGHLLFIQLPFPVVPGIMSEWFPVYNPFIFGLHFVMGTMVWALLTWRMNYELASSYLYDGIWFVFVWILGSSLWDLRILGDFESSWRGTPFHFPMIPLLIVGIIGILPFTKVMAPIFEYRLFKFFAKISYSTYLWHAIVIFLLGKYAFPASHTDFIEWSKLWGLTLVITLFAAWGSYLLFERKLLEWWIKIWKISKSKN